MFLRMLFFFFATCTHAGNRDRARFHDASMQAMTLIGDKRSRETAERVARQKELAKVAVNREDVELIVRILTIHFLRCFSLETCLMMLSRVFAAFISHYDAILGARIRNSEAASGTKIARTSRQCRRSINSINRLAILLKSK